MPPHIGQFGRIDVRTFPSYERIGGRVIALYQSEICRDGKVISRTPKRPSRDAARLDGERLARRLFALDWAG